MRLVAPEESVERNPGRFRRYVVAGDVYARLDRRVARVHAVHDAVDFTQSARVHSDEGFLHLRPDRDDRLEIIPGYVGKRRRLTVARNTGVREHPDDARLHVDDRGESDLHRFLEPEAPHFKLNICDYHDSPPALI